MRSTKSSENVSMMARRYGARALSHGPGSALVSATRTRCFSAHCDTLRSSGGRHRDLISLGTSDLLIEWSRQLVQDSVDLLAESGFRVPDLFAVENRSHPARHGHERGSGLIHQRANPIDGLRLVDELSASLLLIQFFEVGDGDFLPAFCLIHALGVVVGAGKLGDNHVLDVELVGLGSVKLAMTDFGGMEPPGSSRFGLFSGLRPLDNGHFGHG